MQKSLGYVPAVALHFCLNKWWTFGSKREDTGRQVGEYLLMVFVTFLIQAGVFKLLTAFTPLPSWLAAAAANLAGWHDLQLRSLGHATERDDGWWWTPDDVPGLYLRAIALAPGADPGRIAARLHPASWTGLSDPWGTADPTPYGFLIDGDRPWMHRPAGPLQPGTLPPGVSLERVTDAEGLVALELAAARGVLELEMPAAPGAHAYTQNFDGKNYFYAEVAVPVRSAARALPNAVGIIWDSSGSGAARDHGREFALLDAYFRKMKNGEVKLVRLRDAVEPRETFRVVNGDWSALRNALETTPYDGATNFGAFVADAGVAEYLLFSDGLANFGDGAFALGINDRN